MGQYLERARQLRDIEDVRWNCAQAVLGAFAPAIGIDEDTAFRMAANFGGGMNMGSVCGALTGSFMALGMMGITDAEKLAEFRTAFSEAHGAIDCFSLIESCEGPSRPFCNGLIFECASRIEDMMDE